MPSERPTLEDNFCCCAPAPAPLSRRHFLWLLAGATAACAAPAVRTPKEEVAQFPLLDAHSHYVPSRFSFGYTPEELLKAMDTAGIRRMIVLGGREELARQFPNRLIASYIGASFRFREGLGNGSDPKAVEKVGGEFEAVLNRGVFRGIGEVHTHALPIPTAAMGGQGFPGSNISPDSPLIRRLIELAGRYDTPINIHCENYGAEEMARAVRAFPKTAVVWAHTGSVLDPKAIARFLADHPNLSFDLSTKNPACCGRGYTTYPLLGLGGTIDGEWQQLFEAFPDRLLFGVDFFSNQHLARAREVGEMYRLVLSQLTVATARKIGYQNAERLYALPKL